MPRRIVALLAALVAAATLAPVGPPAQAAPAVAQAATVDAAYPLDVEVDAITPGVIPRRGPIRISGEVTNNATETWTTINLYSAISSVPMTTAAELSDALAVPLETSILNRISDTSARGTIDEIAPGDSRSFSFVVPRRLLPVTEAGVYWFGVQAVGQGPEGRDKLTDGQSRTFMSLVPRRTTPLPTSLVLPLRRQLSYAADGSLADLEDWTRTLSSGGRLRSVVELGVSAGSRAVTYVVDPALVAAVEQLAAGNPARSLEATVDPADQTDEGSDEGSPGDGASADATGAAGDSALSPLAAQAQAAALDWLDRLGRALPGHQVMALPYGDLDVAAAAEHSPRTYAEARRRSGSELAPYGLPTDAAVASPGGYLDPAALAMLDPGDTVLLTDAMFAPKADEVTTDGTGTGTGTDTTASAEPAATPPTVATDDGHTIVVTSAASTVGPGPGEAGSPLSVRQETLAQAAVRALGPDPQPLVVMLPNDWNPASSSAFFSGFDVDWLDLTSVGDVAAADPSPTPVSLDDLTYPRFQTRSELGSDSFASADDLTRSGDQLQNLLTRNQTVGSQIRDQALTTLSYSARSAPTTSRTEAGASTGWVRAQLAKVHIEAPPAVTMTGTIGRFSATVTNGIDQPVTVSLDAQVSEGIEISRPKKIRVPAAGDSPGRTRVLLTAKAPGTGVHNVRIGLTDIDGSPIGDSDQLTIRSLHISTWFWVVIAGVGALLFGAIGVRLVRRVRAARRTAREGGERADPDRVDA